MNSFLIISSRAQIPTEPIDKLSTSVVTQRFFPSGKYIWTVPPNVFLVDVFLVGGGGGAPLNTYGGSGSGYTKAFRGFNYSKQNDEWEGEFENGRNGNSISVVPNQKIEIIVGAGGTCEGGFSQFLNSSYRANGGTCHSNTSWPGSKGGSGGGGHGNPNIGVGNKAGNGGSNGHDGQTSMDNPGGIGQGYTTRDFGEPWGAINAGGGAGYTCYDDLIPIDNSIGGVSNYPEGNATGGNPMRNGGGYGGGGGAGGPRSDLISFGGDGTVLIRFKSITNRFSVQKKKKTVSKFFIISVIFNVYRS